MINIKEFLLIPETERKTIYVPILKRLGYKSIGPGAEEMYEKTVRVDDRDAEITVDFNSVVFLHGGSLTNNKGEAGLGQRDVTITLNVVESKDSYTPCSKFYIDFLKKSVHKHCRKRVFEARPIVTGYLMVVVPSDKSQFLSMLNNIESHFRDVSVLNSKVSGRGKRYKKI